MTASTTAPVVYQGPCPTCGQHIWQPVRCRCQHALANHTPNASGIRKACSVTEAAAGPCPCKAFVEAVADGA